MDKEKKELVNLTFTIDLGDRKIDPKLFEKPTEQELCEHDLMPIGHKIKEGETSAFIIGRNKLENYLGGFLYPEQLDKVLQSTNSLVAVLEDIQVIARCRRYGFGSKLVKEFIHMVEVLERSMETPIDMYVIADPSESSFIVKFYSKFGFKLVMPTPSGPLMKIEGGAAMKEMNL